MKFVNTSLHGVSHRYVVRAFETFGLPQFFPVDSQRDPDPNFSTVPYPNPEEPGALDLALEFANSIGASYVLAQDPDADRFCVAERGQNMKWTVFNGDQIGVLLASFVLEESKRRLERLDKVAMVASVVSSKMLQTMAKTEGFRFVECLTGFKYIGNAVQSLLSEGFYVPFAYEEALGYMMGSTVCDKDGVAATVCCVELILKLQKTGLSMQSYLDSLYDKYGYFETRNGYVKCAERTMIRRIFDKIRGGAIYDPSNPRYQSGYPKTLAGLPMTHVRDLTLGYDSTNPPLYNLTSLPLSSGQMCQFYADGHANGQKLTASLTIRTSGTEPKIKYYLEGSGRSKAEVRMLLSQSITELQEDWLKS